MTVALRQRPLARVVMGIVNAANGAWFDPNDMSTMYQDAAGTTPVTSVGQPVGLVLDKSQGLMLGPELVTNGDFSNGSTGWALGTGWNVTTGSATFTGGNAGRLQQNNILTIGRMYRIQFNTTITSQYVGLLSDSLVPQTLIGQSGYKVLYLTATSPTFSIYAGVNANALMDNISVREIYGNHATQPITASRPTLIYENGMYGLRFDGIDDYLNLPYMGLYANGSASIVAARDALSQATDTYVISERSTSNVNPKYFPSRQLANAGNMDAYITNDAAAVVADTVGSVYGGASNAVIRSAIDSGNNIKLFKNGALSANDNYTRSGTLTLTNTTIGASVSTTISNYANMKLYGLCIAKSALSDAERRRIERLLAYNSGAQI